MSVAVHEIEASHPQYEVSAGSFEDLVWLRTALGDYLLVQRNAQNADQQKIIQAEQLRERVIDDVTQTLDGELKADTYSYTIEESDIVLDALQIAQEKNQQAEEPEKPEFDPAFAWLSDPENTHPAAKNTKQNFYDL